MTMKTYRINEIFLSLQGEGIFAGVAAVFVRFSGCNLKCPFCDTDFESYDSLSASEVKDRIYEACGENPLPSVCVLTGGEPTLQADKDLVDMLHDMGMQVNIETNGTNKIQEDIDYVTVSPKSPFIGRAELNISKANEVKVIMTDDISIEEIRSFERIPADWYFIQPCDTGNVEVNQRIMQRCVEFVKYHPNWRLSLQQQKILKIR